MAACVVGTSLVGAGPVQAGHVACGDVITTDTTLDADVGPCPGDGLVVAASGITVDLGGHRVVGSASDGPSEDVGIRLRGVRGVVLRNGTVTGFDAGVVIWAGGGSVVHALAVTGNVDDLQEPYRFVPGRSVAHQPDVESGDVAPEQWAAQMLCSYGGGITLVSSDDNEISGNQVVGNGPSSGIGLLGDSDGNRVHHNRVVGSDALNRSTRSDGTRGPGLCGTAPGGERGHEVQGVGIRVAGPGADDNVVLKNHVVDSARAGIAVHGRACGRGPDDAPETSPNERNVVAQNVVRRTGAATAHLDPAADGIGVLAEGPLGRPGCASHGTTINDNKVMDSRRHGISLERGAQASRVVDNAARKNGGDGISVAEGALSNVLHHNRAAHNAGVDGVDRNRACDNNDWSANRFRSVNQACVASGGTGVVGGG